MTDKDPSVQTAAPDQTVAFTSPHQAKSHTPSVTLAPGEDRGTQYQVGTWNDKPLYVCPVAQMDETKCQYKTLDGDQAVYEHIIGSHGNYWLEAAAETPPPKKVEPEAEEEPVKTKEVKGG